MLHWRQVKHRWCQFFSPEYDHHINHDHDHIDDHFYHIDDDYDNVDDDHDHIVDDLDHTDDVDDHIDEDHDHQDDDFLLTAPSQDVLGFPIPLTA